MTSWVSDAAIFNKRSGAESRQHGRLQLRLRAPLPRLRRLRLRHRNPGGNPADSAPYRRPADSSPNPKPGTGSARRPGIWNWAELKDTRWQMDVADR